MNNSKSPLLTKLAIVAAALSVQTVALAQTAPTPSEAPGASTQQASPSDKSERHHGWHNGKHHRGHHMHHHMREGAIRVPGYGMLSKTDVQALKLTQDQQKLVAEAQEAQKSARHERVEAMKAHRKTYKEALANGKLDPEAALKQRHEAAERASEQRHDIDEKWLAVWEALEDDQKKQVAAQLKERADRHAQRIQERKDHKGRKDKQGQQNHERKAPAPQSPQASS